MPRQKTQVSAVARSYLAMSKGQLEGRAVDGDQGARLELERRAHLKTNITKRDGSRAPGVGYAYSEKPLRVGSVKAEAGKAGKAGKARKAGKRAKASTLPRRQAKAPRSPAQLARDAVMRGIWARAAEIAKERYGCDLREVTRECLKAAWAEHKAAGGAVMQMAANPNWLYFRNRVF